MTILFIEKENTENKFILKEHLINDFYLIAEDLRKRYGFFVDPYGDALLSPNQIVILKTEIDKDFNNKFYELSDFFIDFFHKGSYLETIGD